MPDVFPSPTVPRLSRTDVFVAYLDYFRASVIARVEELPVDELRRSRVASGWTPLELVKHLTYVERRWMEWGFDGRDVDEPWGDRRESRWYVDESETRDGLLEALVQRGDRTRATLETRNLDDIGAPSLRWDGAAPPTLERICLHLLQEYARHLGHVDIVVELAGGPVGE